MPPTINSSELYGKIVSIRMIPSVVVNAHDEWTLAAHEIQVVKDLRRLGVPAGPRRRLGWIRDVRRNDVGRVLAAALRQQTGAHKRSQVLELGRILRHLHRCPVLGIKVAPRRGLRAQKHCPHERTQYGDGQSPMASHESSSD